MVQQCTTMHYQRLLSLLGCQKSGSTQTNAISIAQLDPHGFQQFEGSDGVVCQYSHGVNIDEKRMRIDEAHRSLIRKLVLKTSYHLSSL
jgi:hypothetical protein